VALVTGAAKGIGQAVVELFVAEGARVVVTDIDDELGEKLASSLGEAACYRHLDVSDEQGWQEVAEFVKAQYGVLDILINNAGITGLAETQGSHDPEHFELSDWDWVHKTNLDGVALGCKYGIGLMKSSTAASIVNLSSRSGLVGIPGAAAYASSKAAIRNHTKTVALYCAEQGYPIRCNSLHPGAILTPLWDSMLGEGEQKEQAIKAVGEGIPLGHMGEPMDVAYACVYFASDESKYITGVELNIDGGILAGSSARPGK
jgi:NAD(P)-dependent dehydrogenase (short-subunit alcohol dehydrogenase family)